MSPTHKPVNSIAFYYLIASLHFLNMTVVNKICRTGNLYSREVSFIISAWNSMFIFGRCSCADFPFQGNLGAGGDIGWTSVFLPDVQIPSGIWWTNFT
jgi:hypothetical protein